MAISYHTCGLDSLAESYRVPQLTATIPSHVQLTASELQPMADGYGVVHQSKQLLPCHVHHACCRKFVNGKGLQGTALK